MGVGSPGRPNSYLRTPISNLRPPISEGNGRASRQHVLDCLFALDGLPGGFLRVLRLGQRDRVGVARTADRAGGGATFLWVRHRTRGQQEHEHDDRRQSGNEAEGFGDGEDCHRVLNYGPVGHAADDQQLRVLYAVDAAVIEEDPAAFPHGLWFIVLGFHVWELGRFGGLGVGSFGV